MVRFILFLLFSPSVFAQTDSLRYDKWIGWVTPTSLINQYHPALELGLEYNPKGHLAYSLSYGLNTKNKEKTFGNHQYFRLGVKKYTRSRFNSGYIMGELGLFHLTESGNFYWGPSGTKPVKVAPGRFNYLLIKPGVIIGGKVSVGELRFDLFTGVGYRFGLRRHTVSEVLEVLENYPYDAADKFNTPNARYVESYRGWRGVKGSPYISLGARFGVGFQRVVKPRI